MKPTDLRHKLFRALRGVPSRAHQVTRYWQGLTPRERQQVLLMLAILLSALAWLLFTRPALKTLNHWQQELPRLRSQQAALQTVLAEAGGGQPPQDTHGSPQARLKKSLAAAGLDYQLSGDGVDIQLRFARPIDAGRLVNWLITAPAALGMTVTQASINRVNAGEASPRVIASVTLVAQQQGKGE